MIEVVEIIDIILGISIFYGTIIYTIIYCFKGGYAVSERGV
jgi:hypothetical protein